MIPAKHCPAMSSLYFFSSWVKKPREKISRKKAQLYQLETENIQADLDHTSK
jgi:hypothetical protein